MGNQPDLWKQIVAKRLRKIKALKAKTQAAYAAAPSSEEPRTTLEPVHVPERHLHDARERELKSEPGRRKPSASKRNYIRKMLAMKQRRLTARQGVELVNRE